jgi:hypothetical protein
MKIIPLENQCPYCSYLYDCAYDPIDNASPKEGDFSICIRCGRVARYDPTLKLVPFQMARLVDEGPSAMLSVLKGIAAWRRLKKRSRL